MFRHTNHDGRWFGVVGRLTRPIRPFYFNFNSSHCRRGTIRKDVSLQGKTEPNVGESTAGESSQPAFFSPPPEQIGYPNSDHFISRQIFRHVSMTACRAPIIAISFLSFSIVPPSSLPFVLKIMRRLAKLIGYRGERNRLENPLDSIGDQRRSVKNGKYMCWEAVGTVREDWRRLGREIKELLDCVENSAQLSNSSTRSCSFDIYMIGRTKDTATPTIVVCSIDRSARKEVRKAIASSGVLDGYPAIRLSDMHQPPDLLARDTVEHTSISISMMSDEISVLSPPSDNTVGRRLFISRPDSGALRPATAGPILYIKGKTYQLTVGHAFGPVGDNAQFLSSSPTLDDFDFDGQSDSEEDNHPLIRSTADGAHCDSEVARSHETEFIGDEMLSGSQNSSSRPTETRESHQPSATDQTVYSLDNSDDHKSTESQFSQPQVRKPMIPRNLDRIGRLALEAETGSKPSLDYGLVELEGRYGDSTNEIPFGPNSNQRWLRILKPSKISLSINIVTITASSRFLSGKLCATASYMRLPNQRTFQELYSVRLKGTLADGDCGSAIVDQLGQFYGHIVAGSVGTGLAYIVPAVEVFEDLLERFEGDVTLIPPTTQIGTKLLSKDRTELEPLRIIEFGSERYFAQLLPSWDAIEENEDVSMDKSHAGDCIAFPGQQNTASSPRRSKLNSPISKWRSITSMFHPKSLTETKAKGEYIGVSNPVLNRMPHPGGVSLAASSGNAFEQNFFKLPGDLQAQIIASLSIPDILSLRTTSRRWLNLVSREEAAISRDFLNYNPVPLFALKLYPSPDPLAMNLHYICGIWHRLRISSRLSLLMTKWITEEYFQRRSGEKGVRFSSMENRMRRRLVPIIFTIFHFLETYRRLHVHARLDSGTEITPSQVETKILDTYNDETLLQVHQLFPQFISYLIRLLRPPSYLGAVERSLRGYQKDPPTESVHVAILCVGGLKKLLELSQIEQYEARRTAVDDWHDSITSRSSRLPPPHRTALDRWQWRRPSISPSVNSTNSSTSTSSAIFSTASMRNQINGRPLSRSCCSSITEESLEFQQPVGPLSAAHTRILLQDLPALQEIWVKSGERLLLQRGIVERKQDIKKSGQLIDELIREGVTDADELIYGQDIYKTTIYWPLGWEGLIEGKGADINWQRGCGKLPHDQNRGHT